MIFRPAGPAYAISLFHKGFHSPIEILVPRQVVLAPNAYGRQRCRHESRSYAKLDAHVDKNLRRNP